LHSRNYITEITSYGDQMKLLYR